MRQTLPYVYRALPAVTVLAVLSGCVSSPAYRYHTLNMAPSGAAQSMSYNIEVERFRTSEALAPHAILIKLSPTQAEYYAEHLWLGTLEEQVRRKLRAEFGPIVAGRLTVVISGTIVAFEQIDTTGGADVRAQLDVAARFETADPYAAPVLRKQYEIRIPAAAPRPDEAVQALSQAVEELAKAIAGDVDGLERPR